MQIPESNHSLFLLRFHLVTTNFTDLSSSSPPKIPTAPPAVLVKVLPSTVIRLRVGGYSRTFPDRCQHFDAFADGQNFAASSSCSSHLDWQTINKVDVKSREVPKSTVPYPKLHHGT
jgi:hypothetical protein